MSYLFSI
jgi:hypothetical protein